MSIDNNTLIENINNCVETLTEVINILQNENDDSSSSEVQTILDYVDNVKTRLEEHKIDAEAKDNIRFKKPRLYFSDSEQSYELDIELFQRNSCNYVIKLYNNPNMWTNDGNIYIDRSGQNIEYIIKYMNNDITLLEDLKEMDIMKKMSFINDLDFLELPIKMNFINDLCFDVDIKRIQAWNNRILMINNENSPNLNIWLKKHNLFDKVFNKSRCENITYDEKNNIMSINLVLKHGYMFEDYYKNRIMNEELLKKNRNENNFDVFKEELKYLELALNEDEMKKITKYFCKFIENSSIIKNEEYDLKLQEWIGYAKKIKLIYRGSRDGFSSSSFHRHCDVENPTVTIIRSDGGWIFGGYITVSWGNWGGTPFRSGHIKNDPNAFIFTLKNPHNVPPTQYKKRKESEYAICSDPGYGPLFRGVSDQDDIRISNNCNCNSESWLNNNGCHAYEADPRYRNSLFVNTNGPNSSNYFYVSDYEVFEIEQ